MMLIKELVEGGSVIVLDTNVLLNIYRYSPEFSDFAFECIKTVKDHIMLPATVKLEYDRHANSEFLKMKKRTEEASSETSKQIMLAKTKIVDSCQGLERLQFQDVDCLKNSLSEKMDAVMSVLEDYFEDHAALELIQHSWDSRDFLKEFVIELATNGQVMASPSQEDIYRWCEEGKKRYKSEIPPGYKDAKNKDGVRMYSDLILWQETLRYADRESKNVVFVTDDVKTDWWESEEGNRHFHAKLLREFAKTKKTIVPMISQDFFTKISEEYEIEKNDAVEIALRMTDKDYCLKIEDSVFDSIGSDLIYNAIDYIDETTANIGSEGIDEFEIIEHEFVNAERVNRDDSNVIYEFVYDITLEGTSYEYWGRDEDTRAIIRSDGRDHIFEGQIVVQVGRMAEVYYDFEDDSSFETAVIIRGKLEQTYFSERPEPPGEMGYCPVCCKPLNIENDGGNGFCIKCALEHG